MPRFATALLLALALAAPLSAQSVTVDTIVPRGSEIQDALAIGPDGALYGSRFGSFSPYVPGTTVTRVDLSDGTTSVYARGLSFANGLAFDSGGTLYVANYYDATPDAGRLSRVAPDGTVSAFASIDTLNTVSGAIYDALNNVLYFSSYDNGWIQRITPAGKATRVIDEQPVGMAGMAFDDQNRLHVANFETGELFRLDGSSLVPMADIPGKVGFLAYADGRFFATGIDTHVIYEVSPSGDVTVLAGTGTPGLEDGPAATAQFNAPNGIVATASGDTLYVSDARTRAVRRIVRQVSTASEDAPDAVGALRRPSPNPAGASTRIRFELDIAQTIEMTLLDALGRRLRTLASGPHASGPHDVRVDTRNLAAGIYVVSLRTESGLESRRLVRR